jgi:hypothetical protein
MQLKKFIETWNELQNQKTPKHHKEIIRWLNKVYKSKNRKGLLQAFRNSGKSTLVALFAAWALAENADLRILILSANEKLAGKMAKNIKKIIEKHPSTTHLVPVKKEKWASNEFTIARNKEFRDPSVISAGILSNITGSRADIIICDDVEVPKNCRTKQKREELKETLLELDFIINPDGLMLYVGTPHTKDTIYKV